LPAPDGARPELEQEFQPPTTPTERLIASIWAELLGLDRIGVHDNFFELGGHSLLATQALARLREALQTDLPLRRLFDGPTVAELAAAADEAAAAPAVAPAPARAEGVEALSDEQVRAMLAERLARVEGDAEEPAA
jgi:acyl carrier protein